MEAPDIMKRFTNCGMMSVTLPVRRGQPPRPSQFVWPGISRRYRAPRPDVSEANLTCTSSIGSIRTHPDPQRVARRAQCQPRRPTAGDQPAGGEWCARAAPSPLRRQPAGAQRQHLHADAAGAAPRPVGTRGRHGHPDRPGVDQHLRPRADRPQVHGCLVRVRAGDPRPRPPGRDVPDRPGRPSSGSSIPPSAARQSLQTSWRAWTGGWPRGRSSAATRPPGWWPTAGCAWLLSTTRTSARSSASRTSRPCPGSLRRSRGCDCCRSSSGCWRTASSPRSR